MSSAEALLPTTRSPGTPTQAAQRRRLRPQGNYTYLLGLACVLLVAGSLLVMAVVHHRAGHALPGTPSAQALEDPSSETVAFPSADADTDDSDTDSDLDAGPGAADDAGSLPPVSRRPSEQGMDEQGSPQEMLTPLEVEAQPQVTSEYVLLGAPTTLCWKNGGKLEAVFPKSTTTHARPPLGQAPPEHLCTFSVGMDNITALQLLQRAQSIAPCNQPDGPPCTPGQLYSFRYAVHAAAHASLRYYMPPGSYNQAQLQHSLAMNPLLCGAQVYEYDLLPPQLQWSSQLLATVCPMFKSMLRLMGAVGAQGDTMDSRWDPTLPDVPGRFNPPVQDAGSSDRSAEAATAQLAARADAAAAKSPYYLLAFALYNAERVLPHYIVQVLSLVTYLPPGRVLVSCYESGSKDSTPGWLTFLQGMLDMLQIPSHIVIQGNMTRTGERIPFLAAVRNQALAPLYDPAAYAAAMARVGATPVSTEQGKQGKQGKQSAAVFPADKIMYLNDPFFSWQDIMRLTLHNADLACGLDFQDNYGSLVPDVWPLTAEPVRRRALLGLQQHDASGSDSSGSSLDRWHAVPVRVDSAALLNSLQGPRRKLHLHASWHALKDPINAFYDVWVARDMAGKPFYWVMPLVHDPHGLGLLTQGLPTPVQCCWNAAAVLNAAPFKPGGVPAGTAGAGGSKRDRLQFRSHGKGECAASECSLLCNDFWRTGFRKVLLDPSVRLSYLPYPRTYLHGTVMNGLPALTWSTMQSKLQEQQVDLAAARKPPAAVMCCPIPPDLDYVEWEDCFMDTRWMAPPQLNGTELEAN